MVLNQKKKYEKVQVNKNIFYFGFISKPNDGIIVITLSLWKCHDFETILNSNDVMNIQDKIGNGFGYQERAYLLI